VQYFDVPASTHGELVTAHSPGTYYTDNIRDAFRSRDVTPDDLERSRHRKLEKIATLGMDPWGRRFDDHQPIGQVRELTPPEEGQTGPKVRVAGRVVLKRDQGRVVFLQLRDWTGQIQVFIGKKQVGETGWALAEALDLGDLLGVDGHFGLT